MRGRRLPPGITGVLPPSRLERQECAGSAFSRALVVFPGSSPTGPSSTAELTGSVCPTGRAAPTKNSSSAQGGLLPARARATAVGVGAGTARGALGSARTPGPDPPRPRPGAQRWRHRCRGGRQVRRLPGWALGARPAERSPGPPCRCWGLPRAHSAGTRSAAEVRPGARHRGPPPPPRSSPPGYSQSPGARRGGPRHPRVSGIRAKRTLVNSPAKRSQKPSPPSGLKCFHFGKWGDEICVGQGTWGTWSRTDRDVLEFKWMGVLRSFSQALVPASKPEVGDGAGCMGKLKESARGERCLQGGDS